MKIEQAKLYNPQFEARRPIPVRFLRTKSYDALQSILTKMNNETTVNETPYLKKTRIVKYLNFNNKAVLTDGRMLTSVADNKEQMVKETLIRIGKTELVIENKIGGIIDFYKPFYKSWNSVMKKLEKVLVKINENYDNRTIVKKHAVIKKEYTTEGKKLLEQL